MSSLQPLMITRKTGKERFHSAGKAVDFDLLGFWQWSVSDLVSNVTRGRLAEYIVANALQVDMEGVRNEWDAYDLRTSAGIRVEVKSAAFIQSWHQIKISSVRFLIRQTHAWDATTNLLAKEARRQADVYVFALLAHMDKITIDPLNLSQWQFYVVSTQVLHARIRSQHSITLKSLEAFTGGSVRFSDLEAAVQRVVA